MQTINITPTSSSFTYDPAVGKIFISAGVRFVFLVNEQGVNLETVSLGGAVPGPISGLLLNEDNKLLFRQKQTLYSLQAINPCEIVLFRLVVQLYHQEFRFEETEKDKVDIRFDNGLLHRLHCRKREGLNQVDSLGITWNGRQLILVQQPLLRKVMEGLEVTEGHIRYTAGGETRSYQLHVQPLIAKIVGVLVNDVI